MQKHSTIIAATDVGTTKAVSVIAEVSGEGPEAQVNVIGVGDHACRGLQKGIVTNIDETAAAIQESVHSASQQAACVISSVHVSVGGSTTSRNSTGMVPVRGKEVSREDVDRVLEAAASVPLPPDQKVLHVLPQDFIVNNQDGIKNPIGMCGVRLDAKAHLVTAAESNLQNLAKCVRRSGLEVEGFVLDHLAGSTAVLLDDEKELGVAYVDVGGGATHIIIYVDECVVFTATLPVGSVNVTKDIAIGLNTPIAEADKIKHKYGCAVIDMVDEEERIDIPKIGGRPEQVISRRALCKIVQPRVEQVIDLIHRALLQSTLLPALASGIVLAGGGSIIQGFPELMQTIVEVPVRRGKPSGMGGLANMLEAPQYATAAGIVMFVVEKQRRFIKDGPGGAPASRRGGGKGEKGGRWLDSLTKFLKEAV